MLTIVQYNLEVLVFQNINLIQHFLLHFLLSQLWVFNLELSLQLETDKLEILRRKVWTV